MPNETARQQGDHGERGAERAIPTQKSAGSAPLHKPVARRALLAGASAVAAGAAYTAIAPDTGDEPAKQGAASDPRRLTYRETDHIRQFYARARF